MSFAIVDILIIVLLVIMCSLLILNVITLLKKDPWIWSGGKFKLIAPGGTMHYYSYDAEYDVGPGIKRTLKFLQIFEVVNKDKIVIVTWNYKEGFVQEPIANMHKVAWQRATYLINRQYRDFIFHMKRKGKV